MILRGGNSGATLQLKGTTVHKSVSGKNARRLVHSCLKSWDLYKNNVLSPVKVLPSQIVSASDDYAEIIMEYCDGKSIWDVDSENELELIESSIVGCVSGLFSIAKNKDVRMDLFLKIKELNSNLCHRGQKICDHLISICRSPMLVPVGLCHGDFTLTNLMVHDGSVVAIDISVPWVESPLIDMAKLSQEIEHKWCWRFGDGIMSDQINKMMDRIADWMLSVLIEKDLLFEFSVFSIVNDLRLIPYEKNEHWKNRILTKVENKLCLI